MTLNPGGSGNSAANASHTNGEAWSDASSEEAEITVIQDASSYRVSAVKEAYACPVRGLSEEDAMRLDSAGHAGATVNVEQCCAARMMGSNAFGAQHVLLLSVVVLSAVGIFDIPLAFPPKEQAIWPLARGQREANIAFLARILPNLFLLPVAFSCFVAVMCWKLSVSARSEEALLGVGLVVLGWVASVAQLYMLLTGCGISSISHTFTCDIPFVMYWCCSVTRILGPLVAVWLSCLFSAASLSWSHPHLSRLWMVLLGVPVALGALAVALTCFFGLPQLQLLEASIYGGIFTLVGFTYGPFSCPVSRSGVMDKVHKD